MTVNASNLAYSAMGMFTSGLATQYQMVTNVAVAIGSFFKTP